LGHADHTPSGVHGLRGSSLNGFAYLVDEVATNYACTFKKFPTQTVEFATVLGVTRGASFIYQILIMRFTHGCPVAFVDAADIEVYEYSSLLLLVYCSAQVHAWKPAIAGCRAVV